MKFYSKYFFKVSMIIIIFGMILFKNMNFNATVDKIQAIKPDLTIEEYEKIDLGVFNTITKIETNFQSNVELSNSWQQLILNLTTQNNGDSIDTVIVHTTTNEVTNKAIFNSQEQVGFIRALAHDFNTPQSLIILLNNSDQLNININIDIFLEFAVSILTPDINFLIIKAELIGLNPINPINRQNLLSLPSTHQYRVQPTNFAILEKKLLAWTYISVVIPENRILNCKITVFLNNIDIEYVELNGHKFFAGERSRVQFNWTINNIPTSNHFYLLKILIAPNYNTITEFSEVKVDISVSGILSFLSLSPFDNRIGSHPIPSIIMLPILLIGLFGVPYYFIYQEQVSQRDRNIIDQKNKKKI